MMDYLWWIWNGCQPGFPWWCDGFLWMAITLSIGGLLIVNTRIR